MRDPDGAYKPTTDKWRDCGSWSSAQLKRELHILVHESDVRCHALLHISSVLPPSALGVVESLLDGFEPHVEDPRMLAAVTPFQRAAVLVAYAGRPRAVVMGMPLLESHAWNDRAFGARLLAACGRDAAALGVLKALEDKSPKVQELALETLAEIGDGHPREAGFVDVVFERLARSTFVPLSETNGKSSEIAFHWRRQPEPFLRFAPRRAAAVLSGSGCVREDNAILWEVLQVINSPFETIGWEGFEFEPTVDPALLWPLYEKAVRGELAQHRKDLIGQIVLQLAATDSVRALPIAKQLLRHSEGWTRENASAAVRRCKRIPPPDEMLGWSAQFPPVKQALIADMLAALELANGVFGEGIVAALLNAGEERLHRAVRGHRALGKRQASKLLEMHVGTETLLVLRHPQPGETPQPITKGLEQLERWLECVASDIEAGITRAAAKMVNGK